MEESNWIEILLDQLEARAHRFMPDAVLPSSSHDNAYFPQSPTSLTSDQDYIIQDGSQLGSTCRCVTDLGISEEELRMTSWREVGGGVVCDQCGFVLVAQLVDATLDPIYASEGGKVPTTDRCERGAKRPFVYTPAYHMRRYMHRMYELPRFWQSHYHVPLLRQYLDLFNRPRFVSPAEIKIALKMYGLPHTFNQYVFAIARAVAMRLQDQPPEMPHGLQQALLTSHVILSHAFKALKQTGSVQVVNMVNYYFAIHHILRDILMEPQWADLWPVTHSQRAQHMETLFNETVKCAGGAALVRRKAWATVNFLTPSELENFFRHSTLAWSSSESQMIPLHFLQSS